MNKQEWIQCALEKGMDSFEIYQSFHKRKEVTWFNEQMDTFVTSSVLGTSVRGILNGNVAMIALEQDDDSLKEEIIDSLIEQTKVITSKEKDELRKPEPIDEIKKESHWISPSMECIQSVMKEIEQKALQYDARIAQVSYLCWEESQGYKEITNSYGMDLKEGDAVQYLCLSVVAQDGNEIKDKTKVEIIEDLEKFDIDSFVQTTCQQAIEKLHASSVSSRICPVIFERKAMTALFSSFTGLFSGDLLFKGISPLKGKENTKIFSDKITIVDNPRNTDALSISNFDDEGCPTRRKVLVDHGVFSMALQSTKSAIRNHCESTGNGFKSSYASSVSVQPMNCNIEPGTHSLEDLCTLMKEGLVITNLAGLHAGIDFVSTNFSLQCSGYYVKDGHFEKPVTLITVAANFMELMNKVVEVGNDLDWEYYQEISPSIYFESCSISGE